MTYLDLLYTHAMTILGVGLILMVISCGVIILFGVICDTEPLEYIDEKDEGMITPEDIRRIMHHDDK